MSTTSAYTLLGLPQRAYLEDTAIRAAFAQTAPTYHPDTPSATHTAEEKTAHFAALTEARATLTESATRLRHLHALLYPSASTAFTGAGDMALLEACAAAGAAIRMAESVYTDARLTTTALSRAMLAGRLMGAQEALDTAGHRLRALTSALDAELHALDAAIDLGEDIGPRLLAAAATAAFTSKWQQKLHTAMAAGLEFA